LATTASPAVALGGGQLTDTATVSGRVSPQDDATVDFRLYGPDDATCTAAPIFESLGVAYPAADESVSSDAFTPTAPGTYRWVASYSGDIYNDPAAGACNDPGENVDVTKASPTIETVASDDIVLGIGLLTDSATVSGLVNPQAGATIDFRLYGPDDATCTGAPIFESLGVSYPAADTTVISEPFLPQLAGTYRWVASYSGDINNQPVAGACNDASENVVVEAPGSNAPELPATGGSTNQLLMLIGTSLLLTGGALLVLGNRRIVKPG
jgi:LPXTG-motif cell wall-anchored protein